MRQTPFALQPANPSQPLQGRRRLPADALLLTELNPHAVIDHERAGHTTIELTSFGTVREPCPKCRRPTLNLILRQLEVRMAHLLCSNCHSCYDAHYPDGEPAMAL